MRSAVAGHGDGSLTCTDLPTPGSSARMPPPCAHVRNNQRTPVRWCDSKRLLSASGKSAPTDVARAVPRGGRPVATRRRLRRAHPLATPWHRRVRAGDTRASSTRTAAPGDRSAAAARGEAPTTSPTAPGAGEAGLAGTGSESTSMHPLSWRASAAAPRGGVGRDRRRRRHRPSPPPTRRVAVLKSLDCFQRGSAFLESCVSSGKQERCLLDRGRKQKLH